MKRKKSYEELLSENEAIGARLEDYYAYRRHVLEALFATIC
jgi:hypothetical protein